jgi:hypothetical protein
MRKKQKVMFLKRQKSNWGLGQRPNISKENKTLASRF